MATPQSTGAIDVYVGVLQSVPRVTATTIVAEGNYRPLFLGTGMVAPDNEDRISYFGLRNDLAGDQLNYDDGFAGIEAITSIDLTKWEQTTLDIVLGLFPLATSTEGTWRDEDVGTLMITEGYGYPIWFRNKRRNVAAMVGVGMPAGKRYLGSRLVSHIDRKGVKPNMHSLTWHHRAKRNANGIWVLKDRDMSAVANLAAP